MDENGLEISDPAQTPIEGRDRSLLSSGQVVDLSTWANDTNTGTGITTSKVSGYTYDHAAIGSFDGQTITALKAEESSNGDQEVRNLEDENGNSTDNTTYKVTLYKLYYTNTPDLSNEDEIPWTQYSEEISGISSNNADVFLVFEKPATSLNTMNIHYVDQYGGWLHSDGSEDMNVNWSGWNGNTPERQKITGIGSFSYSYIGVFGDDFYKIDSGKAPLFMKDNDGTIHTGIGSTGPVKLDKEVFNNKTTGDPIVLNDLYQVYKGQKGLTVHFVDVNGKKLAEDYHPSNMTATSTKVIDDLKGTTVITGYSTTPTGHLDSYNGQQFTQLTFTKASDNSWTTTYDNGDNTNQSHSVVNEVWLVYSKDSSATVSATLKVHYVYFDANGEVKEDTDQQSRSDLSFNMSSNDGSSFQSTHGIDYSNNQGNPRYIARGDGDITEVNNRQLPPNKYVDTVQVTRTDNGTAKKLSYRSTHIGSANGPELSWVRLDSDGTILYLSGSSADEDGLGTHFNLTRQGSQWTTSEASGRTFTLRRDSSTGDFTLVDTEGGTVALNLTKYLTDVDTTSNKTTRTYEGTYRGQNQVTRYTVEPSSIGSNANMNYTLTVQDWVRSDSKDIYFVYTDENDSGLYIDNDLIYSGNLKTRLSGTLSDQIYGKNPVYTWYKITTDDTNQTVDTIMDDATKTETDVVRKQNGSDWNMAYEQKDRTWLDVAVDDGERTTGKKVFYRVTLTYDGHTEPISSAPVEIEYYGRLENGSFESKGTSKNTLTAQYTNEEYKKEGVWQSTGTGKNWLGNLVNIEIVNGRDHQGLTNGQQPPNGGYYWSKQSNEQGSLSETNGASWAVDGDNFAELNCEAAGALYQDVITHNNEELSYGLSHRARGSQESLNKVKSNPTTNKKYNYDTMYLVIMPTKTAMTSGSNGGELKTQTDLEAFIRARGGFATDLASDEEDVTTYRNNDQGILIRRISSDREGWHTIEHLNDYIATSELTRFFFVAGPCCGTQARYEANTSHPEYKIPTTGNFLDNVWFTQELPTPTGFTLTVKKTFSGLYLDQLVTMASNATNVNGHDLSGGKTDPFTITLSNKHVNASTGREDENNPNSALNGAKLQFTASGSGEKYEFTPTAVDKDNHNLFPSGSLSSGNAKVESNGDVTMTWTFYNQAIDSTSGDQRYNYTADETGETVAGRTVNSTKSADPADSINTQAAVISTGADATINLTNTYSSHRDNDQPEITVSKTFSGVTPTTVDKIWSGGYKIRIRTTKYTSGSADNNEYADLSIYSDQLSSNAKLVSTVTNDDGSMTYTWTISGSKWDGTTYSVTEQNFRVGDNDLTKVSINDEDATPQNNTDNTLTKEITIKPTEGISDLLSFSTDSGVVKNSAVDTTQSYDIPAATNIIIGQYVEVADSSTADASKKYIVWTDVPLGTKTSNAVINKIKAQFGDNNAASSTVSFRNGNNPGTITSNNATLTYDSSTHKLSFTNNTDTTTPRTWTNFYSTHYSVKNSNPETYDDQDIKIANSYDPIIKVHKVEGNLDGSDLAGVKFRIYCLNAEGTTKEYYLTKSTIAKAEFGEVDVSQESNTSDTRNSSATSNIALSFTTGEDGIFEIGALPKGNKDKSGNYTDATYYLEEYGPLAGYNRVLVKIQVRADGTVTLLDADNKPTLELANQARVTFPDPYYEVTIANTKGTVLPETGGPGTWPFIFTGLALTIFACYLLWKRKRSKLELNTHTGR